METCGIITDDLSMIGVGEAEYQECIRPCGHFGPHLIQREDGVYVAFETDMECDCEGCMSDNSDLWCEIFWEVPESEARVLTNNKK